MGADAAPGAEVGSVAVAEGELLHAGVRKLGGLGADGDVEVLCSPVYWSSEEDDVHDLNQRTSLNVFQAIWTNV